MHPTLISFLLTMLVEAIFALAGYLRNKLMQHMHQRDHYTGSGFEPEYE
jgi:hypothetical protein